MHNWCYCLFKAKELFALDTRYLETLVAVAHRGSLAGAARQQGLTATAVAQRLYALEAEFGTRLFTRAGRRVRQPLLGCRPRQGGALPD